MPSSPAFTFVALSGFFLQSDPVTDPLSFDNGAHNFGLVRRRYASDGAVAATELPDWQRFVRYVQSLREEAAEGTRYKILYLGRHGEGVHNVAEARYGSEAWDGYWAKLQGDGNLFWLDAHLTEKGKGQARAAGALMRAQMDASRAMPAPEAFYVSPLYRCLQTASLTWAGIRLPAGHAFEPVVKELVRETHGEHTCDQRSTRTCIHAAFPHFSIEDGFTEEDELWRAQHRESHAEHDVRTRQLLHDILTHDDRLVVSVTSHSGTIASILRVVGHREFGLPTGGMIPVVVRVTRVN